LLITRLRPAQIFQRDAGSQMVRYFIGPLVPPAILAGRVPVLTWPRNVRIQALHADDVARAYLAAVRLRPGGAINVAADDVLSGAQIASVLSGGRWREIPVPAVRAAVSAAWNARAVSVSPGWVDLASSTALVSTDRAREVLEWEPTRTALDTVREVVQGIVDGAGTASAPLRRR
jgi:nucleoside-diphosphate-sugar epimerase